MKKTKEFRTYKSRFQVIRSDDGNGKIVGYAVQFNQLSDPLWGFFREKILPGAFTNALKISDARALINHDPSLILGRQSSGTLSLFEDETGLRYEIVPPDTTYAKDLMVSVERGDIRESSFAMVVSGEEWDDSGEFSIRTVTEVEEIFDVSPVTYPAYPSSTVGMRSAEAAAREILEEHLCLRNAKTAEAERETRLREIQLQMLAL